MRGAGRSLSAGVVASLVVVVAAADAGAGGARGPGARAALVVVDAAGAVAMLPDGSARAAVPWLQPGDGDLAVSPSGRRLAFSSARTGNRELYVADLRTGVLERLTWTRRRDEIEPAWSPDGSQLAWASGSGASHDLHAMRIDRTHFRRLATGPADDREPSWSPDGRTVAFASNELGGYDLWVVSPGGQGRTLLVDLPGDARAPDWHPTGRYLAFTGLVGAAADVWVADRAGATRRLVASPGYDGRPDWSPDGTAIGFLRGREGTLRPWRARAGGGGATPFADAPRGARQLVWSRLEPALAPRRTALLPDLDQRAPGDLVVRSTTSGRFVLGFTSATDNLGLGSMWLLGRRSAVGQPMLVRQLVRDAAGGTTSLGSAGVLRYERHPPHRHWHLDDFVRYELRTLDGRVVVRDRKTGFCLVDRWGLSRALRGRRAGPPRFVGDCAALEPDALRVEQGSSVGYTDRYPAFFHGQDLELSGLPAGRYLLVQVANPERRLRELDYGNNVASVLLRLSWPGRAGPPRIAVLRRCGATPTCGIRAPTIPR